MMIGVICWPHNGWFCAYFLSEPCRLAGWVDLKLRTGFCDWWLLHLILAGFGRWWGPVDFIEDLMVCQTTMNRLSLAKNKYDKNQASGFLFFNFSSPGFWSSSSSVWFSPSSWVIKIWPSFPSFPQSPPPHVSHQNKHNSRECQSLLMLVYFLKHLSWFKLP